MRYHRALICLGASIAVLSFGGSAAAVVVIDADVEDDGDWSTNTELVFSANATFLSPAFQEGSVAADMNHSPIAPGDSIVRTFAGFPLQEGTYTVEFAIGNQTNAPFPPSINIEFTSMGLGEATSATTPTPASGTWELWTIVWEVDGCHPNLGDDITWELAVTTGVTSNLRFDGVGSLSSSGDGFVVSFEPAVPPGDYALYGELTVDLDGETVRFNSVSGRASIDESTLNTPELTQLDVSLCWNHTFDATALCGGCADSTVELDSKQVLGPASGQTGTGTTQSSILWGALTGWTTTGHLYCSTSPGAACPSCSVCNPLFGFEGTGPPIPLSSPIYDTDPWSFIPFGNPGILFATPEFEITDLVSGTFTQTLRLVGVHALIRKEGRRRNQRFCVIGASTGTDWTWELNDNPSWAGTVTNLATTDADLAEDFAQSITDETPTGITASTLSNFPNCFQIKGVAGAIKLEVGPSSGPPDCAVGPWGCTFNPLIVPLPEILGIPSSPGWGLPVIGLALAALGLHRIRARRAASESPARD